ncbi:MAG TPA: 2-oxoacid:acceptor oxidoreductase subunit alpha [Candidatus Krumholzibacteria bacterium]|nr:2-oxoacid:acceptor oxidoreductase subunit alpha [Candidatus Krumholzibacteria bacterium]
MTTKQITPKPASGPRVERLSRVVVRFAGDSGDGMQITGDRFTATAAAIGNDLSTLPDFPAEIRAPAGTLPGVSAFQIHFSSEDISTPGDEPDVLVAMNPAALKVNIRDLKPNGWLIVNADAFGPKDLEKAGYETNPLEDHSLDAYRILPVEIEKLTKEALKETKLTAKEKERCKNFFALGLMYYLYNRPLDNTVTWLGRKFKDKPEFIEANTLALKAGYTFGEATEIFQVTYEVPPAKLPPGKYRNINGNSALSLGFVAAAQQAGLPLFLGSYPITPASDVLHELSGYKNFNVFTFQAEDEIAAAGAALGASFAGSLGICTTSGPGLALKSETIGLAVMAELPLVVVDIQRAGPSTGMPTKTEQADLLQALFGRHGESPVVVLAACTPADCFWMAFEAARLAITHMVPVILLSDGYLANGSDPWLLPKVSDLPRIVPGFRTDPQGFEPYMRDPATLARPWVRPGTPGMQHRIGGLEKWDGSGNVSYDPENHEHMVHVRAEKVARIAHDIAPLQVQGPQSGDLLVLGWGSTYGAITSAVADLAAEGIVVSQTHLRHMNPLPKNLGEVLHRFRRVLVPELNSGQLALLLRGRFLVDAISYSKVQGQPFKRREIMERIRKVLES